MLNIRKLQMIREKLLSELGMAAERPVIRAVGLVVIQNPFAGRFAEDLTPLWEIGATLAERLMPDLVRMLSGPAVS